jgi:tripartite-type tricarboxylate transporter receptor subunit TctC
MTLARRAFVAALATPAFARAQTYPDRPIRFLIPLAAGSAVDVVARLVAEKMGEILGQRVFVENEPGAAGLIGMRAGARAAPDGYTVLAINDSVVTMLPNMKSDAGYDPFADFAAVTQLVGIKWVLVANPAFPPKTVAELIALAKAKPGSIDYASGGFGSPQHVVAEMFARAADIRMNHVPYRGVTPAVNEVLAGHVPLMFTALSTVAQFLPEKKLRVLAATGEQRIAQLPDVPTLAESGLPGFSFGTWAALLVPAKTPPAIVAKLNEVAVTALGAPALHARLAELGYDTIGNSPAAFSTVMRREYQRTGDLVRAASIRME